MGIHSIMVSLSDGNHNTRLLRTSVNSTHIKSIKHLEFSIYQTALSHDKKYMITSFSVLKKFPGTLEI